MEIELGPVRRGGAVVLEPWTGTIPSPGVCGLVGLNGAGKSTLMLALVGSLSRRVQARADYRDPEGELRTATLALAPQQTSLPSWLTTDDLCAVHGLDVRALAERYPGLLLEEVAGRRAGSLSGGQAQALSVALALGANADLTLLDEPLAALDLRRRRGLMDILSARGGARGPAGAVLLSSQSAADLEEVCAHLLVLAGGQVVYHGSTTGLLGGGLQQGGAAGLEARLLALAAGPTDPPPVGS